LYFDRFSFFNYNSSLLGIMRIVEALDIYEDKSLTILFDRASDNVNTLSARNYSMRISSKFGIDITKNVTHQS